MKKAKQKKESANKNTLTRLEKMKKTYDECTERGVDHSTATRMSIRSYCAGNKWATENAKAVGNW
tara:strand:- start:16 stop:210 length:195 start_codon:yes stop_codon:yes gene_type:complete